MSGGDGVDGEAQRRRLGARVGLVAGGARPDRRAGAVVLRGQTPRAARPYIYLSPLGNRRDRGLAICLSGWSLGRRSPPMGLAGALGTGAADRGVVFCRHPNAGPRLFQLLPHALLLRRRPLPILGQSGTSGAGRCRWAPRVDAAGPASGRTRHPSVGLVPLRSAHLAARAGLC